MQTFRNGEKPNTSARRNLSGGGQADLKNNKQNTKQMSTELTELLYNYIKAKKRRSRLEILRGFSIRLSNTELDEIVSKLKSEKRLRQRTFTMCNYEQIIFYYAIRPKFKQLELF
jgi:hypothetical protein